MLEHTFIHIPGIGSKTERRIWQTGILTWESFLGHEGLGFFSPGRHEYVRRHIEASVANRDNICFFRDRLSSDNLWRLFDRFRDRAVYLDIETNGNAYGEEEITVIGLYDGDSVQSFVNGVNLNAFELAIVQYDLVVTFNGSHFDLPVIRRHFPHVELPPVHVDLRFLLRRLGYRGGLKAIEKSFGLVRDTDIDGMDGYEAVKLWTAYQWGNRNALERLIHYNTADTVHLKPLMERGYREMKRQVLSLDATRLT